MQLPEGNCPGVAGGLLGQLNTGGHTAVSGNQGRNRSMVREDGKLKVTLKPPVEQANMGKHGCAA